MNSIFDEDSKAKLVEALTSNPQTFVDVLGTFILAAMQMNNERMVASMPAILFAASAHKYATDAAVKEFLNNPRNSFVKANEEQFHKAVMEVEGSNPNLDMATILTRAAERLREECLLTDKVRNMDCSTKERPSFEELDNSINGVL